MNENYLAITEALDLTKEDLTKLAINGFQASCMEEAEKKEWIDKVQVYYEQRKD
jgi:adenosine deaminase